MENKLTRLFDENGVNISEMSRKTGIAYGTLYDIAKGKTPFERVAIGYVIKIAHEFGMTSDEIITANDLDNDRYELCQIFDSLNEVGKNALIACARGLHDSEFKAEYEANREHE